VWVPPGQWQDAWDGSIVTGPKTMTVSQPYERIPMWHRRGAFTITVDSPALRVEDQDWSILTLEAFPDIYSKSVESKMLFSREDAYSTELMMGTAHLNNGDGLVTFKISPAEDGASRGWVIRLHLLPGESCSSAIVDGSLIEVTHISPGPCEDFFPFQGVGTAPACRAGNIAEIHVPTHHEGRVILAKIQIQ